MKIENLKDLQKVIALCRKTGVLAIKIDSIELQLTTVAPTSKPKKSSIFDKETFPEPVITPYTPGGITEQTRIVAESAAIATDELTDEQMLFYSARSESFEGQQ